MSKRNFILLIIILGGLTAIGLIFLYFYQPASKLSPQEPGPNFLSQLFPFGKSTTIAPPEVTPPADVSGFEPPAPAETPIVRLRKVSSMPVAGFAVYMKERFKEVPVVTPPAAPTVENTTTAPSEPLPNPLLTKERAKGEVKPTPPPTEFAPAVRYADRATGNIYQTFADKLEERKFSATLIPRLYEAYFGNRAESVVMRYLKADDKTIETFTGSLPKELLGGDMAGDNEIKGSFLPENVSDISLSPDALKIFYLFNIGESAIGITADISGGLSAQAGKKIQVFNSPFTEWLSQWPNAKMITLTTKPSARVPGYMYAINPEKKDFNKILSGINGLTTFTSPSGKSILYGDNNLSLEVYSIDRGNSNLAGIKTLPEKCVWGRNSDVAYCAVPKFISGTEYPDMWYRGEVSFSDSIWKVDIENGNTTMILDPVSIAGGEDVDGIKLALDENENYLFFVNKKDSYLWELELK